jgi:hypothetical protein
MKYLFIWLLTTLAFASTALASSQVTLSALTSTATFDSDNGLVDWTVNGKDYMKQQWFWYRIGSTGPEYSLNTLSNQTVTKLDDNVLTLKYADPSKGLQVGAVLLLSGVDSGMQSDISEIITIKNTGTSPMALHFFKYTDMDLGASDSIVFPDWHSVRQETSSGAVACETVITPVPNYREAHAVSDTLGKLNDGLPSTLDGTQTASGDVTWAYQWDVIIPAHGSFQISEDQQITPEPENILLVVLGVLLMGMRRGKTVHWFGQ